MTAGRRHASTAAGADLAALVQRRHEALATHLAAARNGDVEAVHQARVASRRLREVVPVVAANLPRARRKRLERDLRRLTRALGPVRELDVAAGMVDALELTDDDGQRLRNCWQARLDRERRAPARALRKALTPARRNRLGRCLDAFATVRGLSDDPGWRTALASRLERRARDLRACLDHTGALYLVDPLHEVRIAGKKLRYALELVDETRLGRVTTLLATLKKSQEVLGRLHDIDVLARRLQDLLDVAPGDPLDEVAARVGAALDQESRRLHARYLRRRSALASLTDSTLDILVPRVLTPPRRPFPVAAHAR